MVCLWCVCGVSVVCLWRVCGVSVVCLWCVCGVSAVCLYDDDGQCQCLVCVYEDLTHSSMSFGRVLVLGKSTK